MSFSMNDDIRNFAMQYNMVAECFVYQYVYGVEFENV